MEDTRRLLRRPGRGLVASLVAGTVMIASCQRPVASRPRAVPTPSDARGLEGLAWLAGRWVSRSPDGGSSEELWSAPSGGAMQGVGRTIRGGRTVFFEFMAIREDAGALVFTAWPGGREPTAFTLDAQRRGEVVFVNAAHDFPSRITYRLEPDGRLFTQAAGREDGRDIVDDTRLDPAD